MPEMGEASRESEVSAMDLTISDNLNGTWELVTGRKRSMPTTSEQVQSKRPAGAIETSNSFEVLQEVQDSEPKSSIVTSQNENIPPIFINGVENFEALVKFLERLAGPKTFTIKSTINGVKVFPETIDTYRKVNAGLRAEGADFHTFQLPQDRCPRIVLKNLHHGTPVSIIKEELQEMGYEATNIVNALSRFKKPLPMFFVDITKETFREEIFKIEYLYYSKVKIEEPRKKRMIPQCLRCQQYGHTKSYCNHHPRCVRCGEFHETASCTKSRATPPKCANCDGVHPANYKGCQTLKNLRAQRNARNRQYPTEARKPQAPPPELHEFPPLKQHPNQIEPETNAGSQQRMQRRQQASATEAQHQQSCTGMRNDFTQPLTSADNGAAMLANTINELNKLIQPLFSILQHLSQVTQALYANYGR